ncbi:hypothetical protein [Saccharopolyspora sp. CA-218241]|uniref:hypothetical protein n=1 Tax=Saccharopolyspora sp. CA-218241 TaxID=3240027 RepID=UPI003D99FBD0
MHVCVLGLGEAGARYGADLAERGWTVTGYDPGPAATPPVSRGPGPPPRPPPERIWC